MWFRQPLILEPTTLGRDGERTFSSTFLFFLKHGKRFKRCLSTPSGPTLYRLGFENVISELNFGVGVTVFPNLTTFYPLQSPPGLAQYSSLDVVSSNSFVSLAGLGSTDGPFSVVQWSLTGTPKVDNVFCFSLLSFENVFEDHCKVDQCSRDCQVWADIHHSQVSLVIVRFFFFFVSFPFLAVRKRLSLPLSQRRETCLETSMIDGRSRL